MKITYCKPKYAVGYIPIDHLMKRGTGSSYGTSAFMDFTRKEMRMIKDLDNRPKYNKKKGKEINNGQ